MTAVMIVGLILLGMMAGVAFSGAALISGATLGFAMITYAATGGLVGLILCAVLLRRAVLVEDSGVDQLSAQQVN